jgi:hypothetical protein
MGVFDIVMEKPAEVSIASTDFTRLFHDYVKHTPLQLTSAVFSITISNTPTASTDFSMKKPGEVNRGDGCV